MIPVPFASNAVALATYAQWAREHGIMRYGKPATLYARRPNDNYVYFAEADPGSDIKIGWSKKPMARVRGLRMGGCAMRPVVVLADFGNIDELIVHSDLRAFLAPGRGKEVFRRASPVSCLMRCLVDAADACCAERFIAARPRAVRSTERAA